MTRDKVLQLRALIEQAAVSLPDEDALDGAELFPVWVIGKQYKQGDRFRFGSKLYKALQDHTSQADWKPDSAPALYAEVEKPGKGDSPGNPIPYKGNLELYEGKYYAQDGVTYICTRSTGTPVYHPLSALVGLYVEVVA